MNKLQTRVFEELQDYSTIALMSNVGEELEKALSDANKTVSFKMPTPDNTSEVIVLGGTLMKSTDYSGDIEKALKVATKKVIITVPVEGSFGCGKPNAFKEESFLFLKTPYKIEKIAPRTKDIERGDRVFLVVIDSIKPVKKVYKAKKTPAKKKAPYKFENFGRPAEDVKNEPSV